MSIGDLGWNTYFERLWNGAERGLCVPGRVVAQHRHLWRVAGDFPESWAEASGKLRRDADYGGDWPAVGDWVAAETCIAGVSMVIEQMLPRQSKFSRKESGKKVAEQVIAANIDKAIVVVAPDGDFNLRRIERYLTQIWESGASPVIVLNKADASAATQERAAEIELVAAGAPTFIVSAKTGTGMDAFEASLAKGQTVVFLGSSGVGKSTLVNRLLGENVQATHVVRESDSRGRHTTTSRQLFLLPGGALVIDTPGLRELQLWDAGEGVSQTFADIEQLGEGCRFRDCQHESEPGCAVRAALEEGTLDAGRFENMRKLQREREFLWRKMDPEKRHEYKKGIKISFRAFRRDAQSRDKTKN